MTTKDIILTTILTAMLPAAEATAQRQFDEMSYTPAATHFKLTAPDDAKGVTVKIYDAGLGGEATASLPLKRTATDTWTGTMDGDMAGMFYTFDAGHGETPGVFAKAVGINGRRGAIVDMKKTNPKDWNRDERPVLASPADLVIYEMHWRDFSIDPSSGLRHKGKFLALTEPRAIKHLKELGVNAVHILPSFDYASVNESQFATPQYNWGYDPLNYNVPEGSYSTDPYTPQTRILEFKKMVQALHKAGIRVVLDVVYNHTFDIQRSNFQLTYPDYYYRKNADGSYSDGSGCGNETASEQPWMRQFMLESVLYWIDEYHIDGFRFDLMGVHDVETMRLIRAEVDKIDPSIYIYGEGWSAGKCALPTDQLATKANTHKLDGIGAFCDDMRDALRGPFSDDAKGAFLSGEAGHEESIKFGIAGAIAHPQVNMAEVNYSKEPWAAQPTQMVSYVSCHDDMCLSDRLRTEKPGIGTDELIRLDLLAQTAVLTSQGVPFILSGEEMLRDKKGVHNSYNSPDSINRLDWTNLKRHPEVFAYYKGLIALRRAHPAFRLATAERVRQHLEFLPARDCIVAFRLKDLKGIDEWEDIIVVLNANKATQTVAIPTGTYTIVGKEGKIDTKGMGTATGGKAIVAGQSALILRK